MEKSHKAFHDSPCYLSNHLPLGSQLTQYPWFLEYLPLSLLTVASSRLANLFSNFKFQFKCYPTWEDFPYYLAGLDSPSSHSSVNLPLLKWPSSGFIMFPFFSVSELLEGSDYVWFILDFHDLTWYLACKRCFKTSTLLPTFGGKNTIRGLKPISHLYSLSV